jgi:hypothetical protein
MGIQFFSHRVGVGGDTICPDTIAESRRLYSPTIILGLPVREYPQVVATYFTSPFQLTNKRKSSNPSEMVDADSGRHRGCKAVSDTNIDVSGRYRLDDDNLDKTFLL